VRPQLPVIHSFAYLQHTPSKSLRVEIIHTTNLCTAHLSSYTLQKRPVTHHWPTSRSHCSSAVILLAGQHLVRLACLASFSLLATATIRCSFDLITADLRSDVCYKRRVRHHWPTSHTRCSSAVILLAGLHLVRVARLPSFSSPDNISYALHVWPHSPHRPTSRTRCSSCLILLTEFHLIRVAHLPSFFSLAYISCALLVLPHSSL